MKEEAGTRQKPVGGASGKLLNWLTGERFVDGYIVQLKQLQKRIDDLLGMCTCSILRFFTGVAVEAMQLLSVCMVMSGGFFNIVHKHRRGHAN